MDNRIFSFSVVKTNLNGILEIEKLKNYSYKTGISFSYLIIKAITLLNEELERENNDNKRN